MAKAMKAVSASQQKKVKWNLPWAAAVSWVTMWWIIARDVPPVQVGQGQCSPNVAKSLAYLLSSYYSRVCQKCLDL